MACMAEQKVLVATQTNLIADKAGAAATMAPNLVNAWGLAFNPSGVAWISANASGLAIAYDANGSEKIAVTVAPPAGGQPPAAPTGQLFNSDSSAFMGDVFLFVTEDGTISGWQPSDAKAGVLRVDNSAGNAVYKGATIAKARGKSLLIAADFHNAKIDLFDEHYNPALQNDEKKDDVKGAGNDFVDVYDMGGRLVDRLISRGALNSPWGLAFKNDDDKAGTVDLLIGNFGDGRINLYRLTAHVAGQGAGHVVGMDAKLVGPVVDSTGTAIVIDGLWAIVFGPDAGGFAGADLYFTAGPNDEQNGLFGKLAFQ